MRLRLLPLSLLALLSSAPAALACDGKTDVEAAFVNQHKQAWRTETASKSDSGVLQQQTFDYQPPDRLYRKVVSGDESVETIGIGRWAWSNEGAGWAELEPQFAQMVSSHIQGKFAAPKVSVEFKCLGEVAFEGKTYAGYQTVPETVNGQPLARTIYVDPATRLPAYNIIGAPDGSGEPLLKEVYTYPGDIKVEKPL